jgi:hypothetical protein
MRRLTFIAVALFLFVAVPAMTAPKQPVAKCPKKLANCRADGCSTEHEIDGDLNRRKNLTGDDSATQGDAEPHTLAWMKGLKDPKHFVMGGSRDELTGLGEGKKVSVTAFLLSAKVEGGESCNCGLDDKGEKDSDVAVNTDNHLVLVSGATVRKFPIPNGANVAQWTTVFKQREPESITAEFAPRVRLTHPNFTRAKVRPLILDARQTALPVRVTGMLMFDSQHFIEHHLVRVNNWEIHPILKLEFCPNGETCNADSDAGWQSLDDE